MASKHRSLRRCLTSKVRDVLFSTFGENRLPKINTKSSAREVSEWKQSAQVTWCYGKLFDQIGIERELTYMGCILERVWPSVCKPNNIHIAYAISVCVTLLSPRNDKIKMSELTLKSRTKRYLVRLRRFCKIYQVLKRLIYINLFLA